MKTPLLKSKHQLSSALAFLLGAVGCLQAAFVTGFETSSGYTTNGTVIGVHDTSAPGSNAWTSLFGSNANMTASTANPQSGSLAFQINSTSTTVGDGAYLNLGNSFDTSNPFTISFGLAVGADISTGTGNQVQLYLGTPGATGMFNVGTDPYWFGLVYNNGNLQIFNSTAGGTGSQAVTLGAYTAFSDLGQYITFNIGIDPTSKTYTNVTLQGTKNGTPVDLTSTVQAVNSGWIPSKGFSAASIPTNFSFIIGGNDTGTANLDNLHVVPEPGTAVCALLGGTIIFFRRRGSVSR